MYHPHLEYNIRGHTTSVRQIPPHTADRLSLCTHLCRLSRWELRIRGRCDKAKGGCDGVLEIAEG